MFENRYVVLVTPDRQDDHQSFGLKTDIELATQMSDTQSSRKIPLY